MRSWNVVQKSAMEVPSCLKHTVPSFAWGATQQMIILIDDLFQVNLIKKRPASYVEPFRVLARL